MSLSTDFHSLLFKLRLHAGTTKAQSFEPHTSQGKPDSRILSDPFGRKTEIDPDPDQWLKRWERCRHDEHRELVLEELEQEVARWAYSPDRSTVQGTKEWKLAIALDGRSPTVVAQVFAVSRTTVYRYRREFGHSGP